MDEPAAPKKSSEYTVLSNTSNRYPTCSNIIFQIYDIQQSIILKGPAVAVKYRQCKKGVTDHWSDTPGPHHWSDTPLVRHTRTTPLVRHTIGPTHHWSDTPMVRHTIGPTHQWADTPLVRHTIGPTNLRRP